MSRPPNCSGPWFDVGCLTNYQVDKLARGDKTGFFYGDYRILYLVGSGSFARVYRAVHQRDGQSRGGQGAAQAIQ